MTDHKYILEKYRGRPTRHTCPACKQLYSFARYIDTETGGYVANDCGRCNREDKCGYHYTPKDYYRDNPTQREYEKNFHISHYKKGAGNGNGEIAARVNDSTTTTDGKITARVDTEVGSKMAVNEQEPGRIPKQYLIQSLGYGSNFVAFLCSLFDRYTLESPTIERIMRDYYPGYTKSGAVIYWQIDERNRIRTGKIMQYDPSTGKRIKNESGAIDWVHAKLKRDKILPDDYNLVQCLFGEHLLKRYPDKTVCLVESEKSALIGAGAMPEYLWLATGGKQNLNADKCRVLKGRSVIVFPDLGAFGDWSDKAKRIGDAVGCKMIVADLLEKIATDDDRTNGLDIADYLIRELRARSSEDGNPTTGKCFAGSSVKPPTLEEKALQHLANRNPKIHTLIDALGLVGYSADEKLRVIN